MHIQSNVPLAQYSTMHLGGQTKALITIHTKDELVEAVAWANRQQLPFRIIGGGSNIIFQGDYSGLIIINQLQGFDVLDDSCGVVIIRVGAGERWDTIVERTVGMGLSGIEKLSFIPGTAGATPVQNVGAYGAEIAGTLVELEAYDLDTFHFVTLSKDDCQLSYRNSIFKTPAHRRYIITSITLRLSKHQPVPPFYESLQTYLDQHNIHTYTTQSIREAVIAIRKVRLPDPTIIPNTGSFFKNPIIGQAPFHEIEQRFPDIPHWPQGEQIKLSAGWLIEHAGLKDYRSHGMKLYAQNTLVFVNEQAKTYQDLAQFRNEIIQEVHTIFGIRLEQEPELI